ncbi:hypothetical protein [Streptomyces sp. KL116D]|uniref:hypothetical protein n=1 Tax=Streptomyces sp. KL116D TaxID=3045152 RepID=UPI0035581630
MSHHVRSALRRWATVGATAGLARAHPQAASASVGGGNVSISWSIPGGRPAG